MSGDCDTSALTHFSSARNAPAVKQKKFLRRLNCEVIGIVGGCHNDPPGACVVCDGEQQQGPGLLLPAGPGAGGGAQPGAGGQCPQAEGHAGPGQPGLL